MALTLPYHYGEWTVDDLDALPESLHRLELHDGNLIVSPSPGRPHQWVAVRLVNILNAQVPSDIMVGFEHDVTIERTTVRTPDVYLTSVEQFRAGTGRLQPDEVLVAIEVVSPSSHTTDRILKPAEYAAADIPGFWRVELEPEVTLTAYSLGADGYDELGTWGPGETAVVDAPVSVTIRMDDLL